MEMEKAKKKEQERLEDDEGLSDEEISEKKARLEDLENAENLTNGTFATLAFVKNLKRSWESNRKQKKRDAAKIFSLKEKIEELEARISLLGKNPKVNRQTNVTKSKNGNQQQRIGNSLHVNAGFGIQSRK